MINPTNRNIIAVQNHVVGPTAWLKWSKFFLYIWHKSQTLFHDNATALIVCTVKDWFILSGFKGDDYGHQCSKQTMIFKPHSFKAPIRTV